MNNRATVKIDLDAKNKDVESKLLVLRVTYRRRNRQYSIGETIHLTKKEFLGRSKKSLEAMEIARKAFLIAEAVIKELGTNFTFDAFREKYKQRLTGWDSASSSFDSLLTEYFNDRKHKNCAYKTRKSYETSVNWVIRYRKNATLSSMTPDFVDGLISFMEHEHLKEHGSDMSENTKRMYLRQLKAIFNFAIKEGYTNMKNPFDDLELGSIGRRKAALSEQELIQLIEYIPQNKEEELGKDFFILSIHCCGANLGDILLLKNSNIENDIVSFIRRKTKSKNAKPIEFHLTDEAKSLFNKYGKITPNAPNSLILPYLANPKSEINLANRISKKIKEINAGLKSICDALGWRKIITTYNARHTFATTLRNNQMTTEEIQRFLGHRSSKTTETYLGSLSTEIFDRAKNILENLGSKK